jgi:hypothetical protein
MSSMNKEHKKGKPEAKRWTDVHGPWANSWQLSGDSEQDHKTTQGNEVKRPKRKEETDPKET